MEAASALPKAKPASNTLLDGPGVPIGLDNPLSGQRDLQNVVDGLLILQLIQGIFEQAFLHLQTHEAESRIQADQSGVRIFASHKRCEIGCVVGDKYVAIFKGTPHNDTIFLDSCIYLVESTYQSNSVTITKNH